MKSGLAARDARADRQPSPASADASSTDSGDDEAHTASVASSEASSGASEVDSGMESDDCDYASLGEPGTEFCQVGDQTGLVPHELYDLPDLSSVLSVDTWNECLTEEDRLQLAQHLPDMDQETFVRTLREVLSGDNFYFGSPVKQLFDQLKGGMCEPRVVLYRRGVNYLHRRKHYHWLRTYHNGMIGRLAMIKGVWESCTGYGIEERLQAVKMAKDQRQPMRLGKHGEVVASETDSEEEDDRLITWKKGLKVRPRAVYPPKPTVETFAYGTGLPAETALYGKENPKGTLKVSSSKKGYIGLTGKVHPSVDRSLEMDHRSMVPPHQGRYSGYRSEMGLRNQMRGYDVDEYEDGYEAKGLAYDMGSAHHGTRVEPLKKQLKKHKQAPVNFDYADEEDDAYNAFNAPRGRRDAGKMMSIPTHDSHVHKKPRASYRDWEGLDEDEDQQLALKGAWSGRSIAGNTEKGSYFRGSSYDFSQKGNKVPKTYPGHVSIASDIQLENVKRNSFQNGGRGVEHARGRRSAFVQAEATDSDSSGDAEGDSDDVPLSRTLQYQSVFDNHQNADVRTTYSRVKATKHVKNTKSEFVDAYDEGEGSLMQGVDFYKQKGKQKSKIRTNNYANDSLPGFVSPTGKFIDEQKQTYKAARRDDGISAHHGVSPLPPAKSYTSEKKKKGLVSEYLSPHPDYMRDYPGPGVWMEDADGADGYRSRYSGNIDQDTNAYAPEADVQGNLSMPSLGPRSVSKKRKGKTSSVYVDAIEEPQYQQGTPDSQVDVSVEMKKGKKKMEADTGPLPVSTPVSIPPSPERETFEIDTKPARKPFTLITPTVHTGFSFSIVHLLSAVRKAMVTVNTEENGTDVSQPFNSVEESFSDEQRNLPSLTVQEIVNRVRSNPGDPCILETQEPLQDLVRGVLKIFSSRTAPLGAKGWKQLVAYEKSNKSWYWTGPVSPSSSDPIEEETSSEAWDIPHKMLVKLVDAFAIWLKSGQETLRQIGSLPPAPIADLSYLDEKERFRDLRAQKSLVTIIPSTDEIRAYFRMEEYLRYQVPDRAFSYTAADGKKSIVAPLRRGGGKPTSKARDHFMLKQDRPPHVTILCLVRDAAARLPGSIGTRADVCILLRDSQYIVEDVTDTQVNQVVSGALDRLHYERDPCVQYDSERKLWVYLHRDREEEDFEDDGTSSTKKWKKPRKDEENPDAGNDEQDTVGVSGYDFNSDPNADPSLHDDKPELVYSDLRPNTENVEPFIDSMHGGMRQGPSMGWKTVNTDSRHEDDRLLCQENSTSENFDDEAFVGRPVVY